MKLVYITSYYHWVLRNLYSSTPSLASETYSEQLNELLGLKFAWSDVWKDVLEPHGYNVDNIVFNAEHIQKAWASENGIVFSDANWRYDILSAQLKTIQPEIIFLDDYSSFSVAQIKSLKSDCPQCRLIFGWCGAPYKRIEPFSAFDFVLSNIRSIVHDLTSAGVRAFHFKHAFDSRIRPDIDRGTSNRNGITFSGSIVTSPGWHDERMNYLNQIAANLPLEVASSAFFQIGRISKGIAKVLNGFAAHGLSLPCISNQMLFGMNYHLISCLHPPLIGNEMYRFISKSTTTFNIHIGKSKGEASNMRLFEATGVGACLLTDHSQSLDELFEGDFEVVSYSSTEECLEKAKWLLDNPKRALEIGANARNKVLANHTFYNRANDLDKIIKKFV